MKGADLERATAAPLQARGWYLLRGATGPSSQVFELDVVGYRFDGGAESSIVLEAKGGKSGFGDLWKLVGLKTHLGIQRGVLLANPTDPLHARKIEMAAGHQIAVIDREADRLPESLHDARVLEQGVDGKVLEAWQLCYRVEDGLVATLMESRLWEQYETSKAAKEHLQHLVSKGWMEPDPRTQATQLYELYGRQPKLALRMATEMDAKNARAVMDRALKGGDHREIQACLYLEHRKRLAVAFAATRCAAAAEDGPRAEGTPHAFRTIVDRIASDQAWYLPTVLQVYFLGFGGMVRLNDQDAEFAHLAAQAGCSSNEAKAALALFDQLFPYTDGGSWFYEGFGLSRLKLMPVSLRGAGIRMREAIYGREWASIATSEQLRVVGPNELSITEQTERWALPRHERAMRAVRSIRRGQAT